MHSNRVFLAVAQAAIPAAAILLRPAAHADPCTPAQIAVEKVHTRNESIATKVTGILVNHCSVPTGSEIKLVFYNAAGDIVTVEDVWPASVSNVPAGGSWPFQMTFVNVPRFKSMDVTVIKTSTWRN